MPISFARIDSMTVLIAATAILAAVGFVVLFYQTSDVRWVIASIERNKYATPQDLPVPPEVRQCVRAYAVVADRKATQLMAEGGPPVLEDNVRMICSTRPASMDTRYNHAHWIVLRRSSMTDALERDVAEGTVRYAAIGGALVRVMAASHVQPLKDSAMRTLQDRYREYSVFAVAPAFDVVPVADTEAVRGDKRTCTVSALLPIPSSPERLWALLKASGPSEINLHVWGYGSAR
jgi:hypothetical protein